MKLHLYIGDKNLSSWSLRPWLALRQSEIAFEETVVALNRPGTADMIAKAGSPSGLVPCLFADGFAIWDSLSICEFLAEAFPDKALWPKEAKARARARSVAAEMHSGFAELRKVWPMNFARAGLRHLQPPGVRRDIDRIAEIWTSCRREFGDGGPFLFGRFSAADAMYAPVVSRFMTYGPVDLAAEAAAYRDMIWSLPAMRAWGEGAARETG